MHAIATKSIYKDKCGFSLNEEVVAMKIGSTSLSPVDQIHQCQCLRLRRSEGPVNEEVDAQEAVAKNGVNLIVTRGAPQILPQNICHCSSKVASDTAASNAGHK